MREIMLLTLNEWASKEYKTPPSIQTLRTWAKSGQIHPLPKQHGGRWMVEENAKYIGVPAYNIANDNESLLQRIFSNG
ncbi:excisionase [Vibrio parahaemolyticus]|nr:excisionase [Vibrio parahaemolyticus]TOK40958.1 excisionase [Vibrio parahaemolyticus]